MAAAAGWYDDGSGRRIIRERAESFRVEIAGRRSRRRLATMLAGLGMLDGLSRRDAVRFARRHLELASRPSRRQRRLLATLELSPPAAADAEGGTSAMSIVVRHYLPDDAAATLEIFRRAVAETARSSYTTEQTAAWGGSIPDLDDWNRARLAAGTVVAESSGVVAGYSDLGRTGHVDHLYVSPDFGRRGIGGLLLAHVISEARRRGLPALDSRASLVAWPVFERAGFVAVERETVVVAGVPLDRFVVALDLG
jgi:putative acetyltransferase